MVDKWKNTKRQVNADQIKRLEVKSTVFFGWGIMFRLK